MDGELPGDLLGPFVPAGAVMDDDHPAEGSGPERIVIQAYTEAIAWLGHKDIKTTMRYLASARGTDVRRKVNDGLLASAFSPQARQAPLPDQIASDE